MNSDDHLSIPINTTTGGQHSNESKGKSSSSPSPSSINPHHLPGSHSSNNSSLYHNRWLSGLVFNSTHPDNRSWFRRMLLVGVGRGRSSRLYRCWSGCMRSCWEILGEGTPKEGDYSNNKGLYYNHGSENQYKGGKKKRRGSKRRRTIHLFVLLLCCTLMAFVGLTFLHSMVEEEGRRSSSSHRGDSDFVSVQFQGEGGRREGVGYNNNNNNNGMKEKKEHGVFDARIKRKVTIERQEGRQYDTGDGEGEERRETGTISIAINGGNGTDNVNGEDSNDNDNNTGLLEEEVIKGEENEEGFGEEEEGDNDTSDKGATSQTSEGEIAETLPLPPPVELDKQLLPDVDMERINRIPEPHVRPNNRPIREAYVVYMPFEGSEDYLIQGGLLLHRIAGVDMSRSFVVLYGKGVHIKMLHTFFGFLGLPDVRFVGIHDLAINPVWSNKQFVSGRYSAMFSKLSIWALIEFDRIMYLDMDFILRYPDKLLELWDICPIHSAGLDVNLCGIRDSLLSADDPVRSKYINGGLLVVRPSLLVYTLMVEEISKGFDVEGAFAEQDFLFFFFQRHAHNFLSSSLQLEFSRFNKMHMEGLDPEDNVLLHFKGHHKDAMVTRLQFEWFAMIQELEAFVDAIQDFVPKDYSGVKNDNSLSMQQVPVSSEDKFNQEALDAYRKAVHDYTPRICKLLEQNKVKEEEAKAEEKHRRDELFKWATSHSTDPPKLPENLAEIKAAISLE